MSIFKNIFLPVDFSINTEIAIKKAIELVKNGDATIHLLHVAKPSIFWKKASAKYITATNDEGYYYNGEVQMKLEQWKQTIEETVAGVTVEIHLMYGGSVQDSVIKLCQKIKPQLVIIAEHSNRKWFSFFKHLCPNKIAKATSCAVLTVKPGALYSKVRCIVVPVSNYVPQHKIAIIQALAAKYFTSIHIVTLGADIIGFNDTHHSAGMETYNILKTQTSMPIEYHKLQGSNLAKASFDFAQKIMADMLLVTPITETQVTFFSSKQINDLITYDSKLQILSVQPF